MTKDDYISPYDSSDSGTIIDRLIDDYVIDGDYDEDDYDELETIINDAIEQFNNSILQDDDIDNAEEFDYVDLRENMYQSIQNSVFEKYSKAIKE
jgi:hypothetical protein